MSEENSPRAIPVETSTTPPETQGSKALVWVLGLLLVVAVALLAFTWVKYRAAQTRLQAIEQAQVTLSNQLAASMSKELDAAQADAEALNYGLARDRVRALRAQLNMLAVLSNKGEGSPLDEAWSQFGTVINALGALDPDAPSKLKKLKAVTVSALRNLASDLQPAAEVSKGKTFDAPILRGPQRPAAKSKQAPPPSSTPQAGPQTPPQPPVDLRSRSQRGTQPSQAPAFEPKGIKKPATGQSNKPTSPNTTPGGNRGPIPLPTPPVPTNSTQS